MTDLVWEQLPSGESALMRPDQDVMCAHCCQWPVKDPRRNRFCSAQCRANARRKPAAAFWLRAAVGSSEQCWEWQGPWTERGYGRVWWYGITRKAYRVAWELVNGPIPSGAVIRHQCDNRGCVNPSHLLVGTQLDNIRDRVERRRSATGASSGVHTKPDSRARGERSGAAKLKEADIHYIRQELARGRSQLSIGRQFGLGHTTIWSIASGKTWAWLTPEPVIIEVTDSARRAIAMDALFGPAPSVAEVYGLTREQAA